MSTAHAAHSRCPNEVSLEEMVDKIPGIVIEDRRIQLREIAEMM